MTLDAVIVGSGPNGLAAAVALAQRGLSVSVFEAHAEIGGGTRTTSLTLPGFRHDVCSAVHPMALASPFFQRLPLAEHGLRWIWPRVAAAHPLDRSTVTLVGSLDETAASLGVDEFTYRRLFEPLAAKAKTIFADTLRPLTIPRHPFTLARFGWSAIQSTMGLAESSFRTEEARALLAGMGAHSFLPLDEPLSAAIACMLIIAGHSGEWPIPKGGSDAISGALASYLRTMGGTIHTGINVTKIEELPQARAYLFDLAPRALASICGTRLPDSYRARLARFRTGPGVFKMDWAMAAPVPWYDARCREAGTVHVGGTLDEIAFAEQQVANGECPERPFVLLAQPSLFDPTRAPPGRHVLWGYCHVPNGSSEDMTARIEKQIERFAPGFRDLILHRHVMFPSDIERHNANCIGGDISGGAMDWRQLFTRPTPRLDPYSTPAREIFICSASTPPGGGVHGMCGYWAAQSVLRKVFGLGVLETKLN